VIEMGFMVGYAYAFFAFFDSFAFFLCVDVDVGAGVEIVTICCERKEGGECT
jgi:hypothetical protein